MKREIKFRAKRSDTGEWVYGSLTTQKLSPRFQGDYCIFDGAWHEIDPDTVGQYTGLNDCNDKEIYEGDIIDVETVGSPWVEDGIYKVMWDKLETQWALCDEYNNSENLGDNRGHSFHADDFADYYRVIGNIHDNPELLEGGEQ